MSRAGVILGQIVAIGLAIVVIGGVVGLIIGHFAFHKGGAGLGWGIAGLGAAVAFLGGGSGSPSENMARGQWGAAGNFWGEGSAQPMTPLQAVLGGALALALGIGVLYHHYS